MMRRPGGYAVTDGPDARTEHDTFTCKHCNVVVYVKPKAPPEECGGFCRQCMALVCPSCADGSCVPFEKKLEKLEASARFRAALDRS